MADIRWICLSDTHFGAENSLLSDVDDGSAEVNPATASGVLTSLLECLRAVLETNGKQDLPTLVLNGDILELALASDEMAAMVFDRFIDLAFGHGEPLFDKTIIYLPGNHDHHIWETARERQYADYVRSIPPNQPLPPPWHATNLFQVAGRQPLEAELLTALVQRRAGKELRVKVVYPNLGIASPDESRVVLVHHGHFTESMYRLMSAIKLELFPLQQRGQQVWDWEADNFAWIDFFWSTLGRSGDVGQDVGLIYDMLQDRQAVTRLAGNLGTWIGGRGPGPSKLILRPLARSILRFVSGHTKNLERSQSETLTVSGWSGVSQYLGGPLLSQIASERKPAGEGKVAFVFGHTHKPFEATRAIPGFAQPVSIYNSGGWVVDTELTKKTQGAAVILVDEDCNVASLRMYNQADSSSDYAVWLASDIDGTTNDLHNRLNADLHFDRSPWTDFSEKVADEVALRHRLLPQIIRRGLAYTAK